MDTLVTASGTLFTRADAINAGLRDRDLRSSYQRVIHGVYTTKDVTLTHELKCRAASMTLPRDAIITARSAATLLGIPLAGAHDNVEVLVSNHKYMNRRHGLRCWARQNQRGEHTEWHGIRLATPNRSALDLLCRYSVRHGVANCDAMLHAGLLDERALSAFLMTRSYYGISKARRCLGLLDGRAESIPESVLRVTLIQAGLHPTPQVSVHDAHSFVARIDLAFKYEKVGIEYDGAWHGDPAQQRRDQARLRRLRDCGWHVIVVTAKRLHEDAAGIILEVRNALESRRSALT